MNQSKNIMERLSFLINNINEKAKDLGKSTKPVEDIVNAVISNLGDKKFWLTTPEVPPKSWLELDNNEKRLVVQNIKQSISTKKIKNVKKYWIKWADVEGVDYKLTTDLDVKPNFRYNPYK